MFFRLRAGTLFTIVMVLISLLGCKPKKTENTNTQADRAVPVEVVTIETGTISAFIQSYANIEAQSAVTINARTAEQTQVLHVEEGDIVKKGDLLLTLRNDEQRIALNKIRSTLEKNQNDLNRQEHLKQRDLVSGKDYANAKDLVQQSVLDKERAQLNYDYTFVRAPIDGTVTERFVNVGQNVKVNDALFSLVDFNSLVTYIYLPQDALANVQVGQRARLQIDALSEATFTGQVLRISPIIDPKSGTFKVTIAVDSAPLLRPGMYVKVLLTTAEKNNAVLIPKQSLVNTDEQTFVYIVENARAKRIAVEAALSDTDFITPVSGVNQGDKVIIAGQNNLKPNAKVRIVNAPTADQPLNAAPQTDTHETPTAKANSEPANIRHLTKPKSSSTSGNQASNGSLSVSSQFNDAPIKQENESRESYRKRIREYVQQLAPEERAAFQAMRKKQREQRKQEAL